MKTFQHMMWESYINNMLLTPNLKHLRKNKCMAICLKKSRNKIKMNKSTRWTTDKYIITSHFEGYAFAIHEKEINTKDLQY